MAHVKHKNCSAIENEYKMFGFCLAINLFDLIRLGEVNRWLVFKTPRYLRVKKDQIWVY